MEGWMDAYLSVRPNTLYISVCTFGCEFGFWLLRYSAVFFVIFGLLVTIRFLGLIVVANCLMQL